MDKPAELALLLDAYGSLLSERQRQLIEMRVDDDLTYTEIAQNLGISRQGAHDAVTKAVRYMEDYERRLGAVGYRLSVQDNARTAMKALSAGDTVTAVHLLMKLADVIKNGSGRSVD